MQAAFWNLLPVVAARSGCPPLAAKASSVVVWALICGAAALGMHYAFAREKGGKDRFTVAPAAMGLVGSVWGFGFTLQVAHVKALDEYLAGGLGIGCITLFIGAVQQIYHAFRVDP